MYAHTVKPSGRVAYQHSAHLFDIILVLVELHRRRRPTERPRVRRQIQERPRRQQTIIRQGRARVVQGHESTPASSLCSGLRSLCSSSHVGTSIQCVPERPLRGGTQHPHLGRERADKERAGEGGRLQPGERMGREHREAGDGVPEGVHGSVAVQPEEERLVVSAGMTVKADFKFGTNHPYSSRNMNYFSKGR